MNTNEKNAAIAAAALAAGVVLTAGAVAIHNKIKDAATDALHAAAKATDKVANKLDRS
jgi:hypothetical protein